MKPASLNYFVCPFKALTVRATQDGSPTSAEPNDVMDDLQHLNISGSDDPASSPKGLPKSVPLNIKNCPGLDSLPQGLPKDDVPADSPEEKGKPLNIKNCPELVSLPENLAVNKDTAELDPSTSQK